MICPVCGNWADEGDTVCPSCGTCFSYDGEYECPHCHEMFNVFGSVYEAPKGTYSYHELSAEPVQE